MKKYDYVLLNLYNLIILRLSIDNAELILETQQNTCTYSSHLSAGTCQQKVKKNSDESLYSLIVEMS